MNSCSVYINQRSKIRRNCCVHTSGVLKRRSAVAEKYSGLRRRRESNFSGFVVSVAEKSIVCNWAEELTQAELETDGQRGASPSG